MWQRYAAIGDSITAGFGDPVQGVAMRSWPARLYERLRPQNRALRYLNAGISGSTLEDVVRDQLPAAVEMRPDLFSITVGANDIVRPWWNAAAFNVAYGELLEQFVGATLITLTYPVPITADPHSAGRLETVNDIIRQISGRLGAILLDLADHPAARDPANLSWDGLHPNARGYRLIADYAWEQLQASA